MNVPDLDGWGGRRSIARDPRTERAGRRTIGAAAHTRTLIGAVGVSVVLVLAGCTSTGTEVPRTTDGSPNGVTSASVPYAGTDPSAAGGRTDQPVAATQDGSEQSAAPAATTEVPAPGGPGNIQDSVPTVAATSNPPVALDAAGDYGNGVTVALTSIESVTTEAQLPGEIAGPGVRLEVTITNGSAAPIDVSSVIVDLQDAAGTPALPMSSGATPFTGSIDAGAAASGVYVFSAPAAYTNPATISVSYSADAPVVVFTGDAK